MRSVLLLVAAMTASAADIYHVSGHGQSLCLGQGAAPGAISTTQPYSNKRLYLSGGTTSLIPLVEGLINWGGGYTETYASGMANEVTYLSTAHGFNVSVDQNDCLGGTPYSGLARGTVPYNNWLAALTAAPALAAAGGFNFHYAGGFVIHGEADALNNVSAAAYAGYLQTWQSNLEADANAALARTGTLPMLVSQMSSWTALNATQPLTCAWSTCNGTQARGVPLGQLDAARNNPGKIYFLGPKYQYPYADSQHLTDAGYLAFGELAGKAWKSILIDHRYWTGLVPRSISISGSTVTFRAWVPAGTLALDTSTLPDATYCQGVDTADPAACTAGGAFWVASGFEWWDDSGNARPWVTSVSITAADTVTISLSAPPTGGNQRLRYAFTGPAGSAKYPDATRQPHGNIRDTDAALGVTDGAHLYDWLATFDDPVGFSWSPPSSIGLFPLPAGFRR